MTVTPVNNGTLQCNPKNPILFNIVMNQVLKQFKIYDHFKTPMRYKLAIIQWNNAIDDDV